MSFANVGYDGALRLAQALIPFLREQAPKLPVVPAAATRSCRPTAPSPCGPRARATRGPGSRRTRTRTTGCRCPCSAPTASAPAWSETRAALELAIDLVKSRSTSYTGAKMRDFQTVQLRVGAAGHFSFSTDAQLPPWGLVATGGVQEPHALKVETP